MKEAVSDTRGQVSPFCAEAPLSGRVWRPTELISPVASLWGWNSSLSVNVSSAVWDETYSRHNNTYQTPTTCNLSLVFWYSTKTSKRGNTVWPIPHGPICRLCSPVLTIQVSYVEITLQIIFHICWLNKKECKCIIVLSSFHGQLLYPKHAYVFMMVLED